MQTQKPRLDDLFRQTRTEEPVLSETELDGLLDRFDSLDGGSADHPASDPGGIAALTSTKGIVMSILSVIVAGTLVGGALTMSGPESGSPMTDAAEARPAITSGSFAALPIPSSFAETERIAAVDSPTERTTLRTLPPTNGEETAPFGDPHTDGLNDRPDGDDQADIERILAEELATWVVEFWDTRINEYRRTIDRNLPASDRSALDRLRVRWAINEGDDPFGFALNVEERVSNGEESLGMGFGFNSKEGMTVDQSSSDEPNVFVYNSTDDDLEESIAVVRKKISAGLARMGENTEQLKTILRNIDVDINIDSDGNEELKIMQIGEDENITLPSDEEIEVIVSQVRSHLADLDPEVKELLASQNGLKLGGMFGANEVMIEREIEEDVRLDPNGEEIRERRIMVRREIVVDGADEQADSEDHALWIQNRAAPSFDISTLLRSAIESKGDETSKILSETWDLADRNRAMLDDVRDRLIGDLEVFADELADRTDELLAEHGESLPEELVAMMKKRRSDGVSPIATIGTQIAPVYEIVAEPLILLYNGSDIAPALTDAFAKPVTGLDVSAGSVLAQSYPNPASSSATVEFDLPAASSATTIRLFDATGNEVLVRELGARAAGNGSVQIDLAGLPSGQYLYHLTATIEGGERVYSRTMQIAR